VAIIAWRRRKQLLATLAGAVATAAVGAGVAFAHPDAIGGGSVTARGVARVSHTVDIARALAVGQGGKLVVAGLSSKGPVRMALARYTASGRLDRSFGAGGEVLGDFGTRNDSTVSSLAMQADGKVVAAGAMTPSTGLSRFALARYTLRGRLDPSFGRKGEVLTRFGSGRNVSYLHAVALQSDGKFVAVGEWRRTPLGGPSRFAVARYTARGRLDPSFGQGGKVLTDFGVHSDSQATAIAVQPDGKVVVAGGDLTDTRDDRGVFASALVRYKTDGKLDPSFGNGGRVVTKIDGSSGATALVVQPDGKLIIAGSGDRGPALIRFTADGKLDPSFGKGGELLGGVGFPSTALALQRDGKFVTAGTGAGPSSREDSREFALARCTKDGGLDSSFGSGGKLLTDFHTGAAADAVVVQSDGKIAAAGTVGSKDFAVARYTSNGRLDTQFGVRGRVVTDFGFVWPSHGQRK
jgi:uncharacterized delta-60 repeat protein